MVDLRLRAVETLNGHLERLNQRLDMLCQTPGEAILPAAGNLIEELISFVDKVAGDPDLEDGNDAEPSLGWPGIGTGLPRVDGNFPDEAEEDDPPEDDGTREPSLGAPERHASCRHWEAGYNPTGSQLNWAAGGDRDLEFDPLDVGERDGTEHESQWRA